MHFPVSKSLKHKSYLYTFKLPLVIITHKYLIMSRHASKPERQGSGAYIILYSTAELQTTDFKWPMTAVEYMEVWHNNLIEFPNITNRNYLEPNVVLVKTPMVVTDIDINKCCFQNARQV